MTDSLTYAPQSSSARPDVTTLPVSRSHAERPVKTSDGTSSRPAPEVVTLAPVKKAPPRGLRQRAGTILRRVVGVTLVTAALWWLALPLLFPVTSDALVNARTVQVRAPIEGTATELTFDVGSAVEADQPMARLINRHLDTSGLTGLTARRAELVTRLERLKKELAEVIKAEKTSRAEANRYRSAVVANLEATQEEQTSKARSSRVEHQAAIRRLGRYKSMTGSASSMELDAAKESESVTRIRVDTEEAALHKYEVELNAANRGLFLQKDVPHFQKQADELALKVPTLNAELAEAEALLAEVKAEIAHEQARTDRLSEASAVAPVGGTVWVRQGNRGQGVKQNEVLYEIADTDTVFVEAAVHQRYLAAVTPGTPVVVNVTGGPSLTGRVRAVRTGRPRESEPTFAFSAAERDPKMLRVVVDLDAGHGEPATLIGRHVRVLIADPNAGVANRAVVWLFSNMRLS